MDSLELSTAMQIMDSLKEQIQATVNDHPQSSHFGSDSSLVDLSFAGRRPTIALSDDQPDAPKASSSFLSFGPPTLSTETAKELGDIGSTWTGDQDKRSRAPSCAQDHAIAERKRRERLNQHFIALSTIIPGLKKIDKATLLGGTIGYIKQLEEKVKNLELKASESDVESSILAEKCSIDNLRSTSADENVISNSEAPFPKISASLNGQRVLVRIQCELRKGVFVRVLSEMEKHHLSVISTSVMPFASSSHNITVTAEDLVKDIDAALSQYLCRIATRA